MLRINFSDTSLKSLSEASNQEDLLVIKNFELKIEEEEGGTYVNVLCRVLNGEESFRGFDQARRVPVILLAHSIPKGMREPGPMQSRIIRLPLRKKIEDLSEERLIATFWGCMERRKGTPGRKSQEGRW